MWNLNFFFFNLNVLSFCCFLWKRWRIHSKWEGDKVRIYKVWNTWLESSKLQNFRTSSPQNISLSFVTSNFCFFKNYSSLVVISNTISIFVILSLEFFIFYTVGTTYETYFTSQKYYLVSKYFSFVLLSQFPIFFHRSLVTGFKNTAVIVYFCFEFFTAPGANPIKCCSKNTNIRVKILRLYILYLIFITITNWQKI